MPTPFRLCDNFFEYVAKCFIKGFRQSFCRGMVNGKLVLGKLKLLTQANQQAVNEGLTIISDNIPQHIISIDDVCPYEVDHIIFFDLP